MVVGVKVGVTVGDTVIVWVVTGNVKVGDKIFSSGFEGVIVAVPFWSSIVPTPLRYTKIPKQ